MLKMLLFRCEGAFTEEPRENVRKTEIYILLNINYNLATCRR